MRSAKFAIAFVLATASLAPWGVHAQEESWKGKSVIIKEGKVEFFQQTPGMAPVLLGELHHITYKVKDEKDGKLLVRQKGIDGWIAKESVLPIEQALDYFSDRIQLFPNNASYFGRRAEVWRWKGNLDNAIKDLDEAVRLAPQESAYYNNRGTFHAAKKDYDSAIQDYNEALRLKPNHPLTLRNRGHAWLGKKDFDKAFQDFNEAAQLDPRDPFAHHGRGRALAAKKQYAAAVSCWDAALNIDPDMTAALNSKAWLLATCPDDKVRDGKKAIELAKKACALTDWKDAGILDTLAAAHAEAGQFTEAVHFQQQALKDEKFGKNEDARRRLKLYQEKKTWREE